METTRSFWTDCNYPGLVYWINQAEVDRLRDEGACMIQETPEGALELAILGDSQDSQPWRVCGEWSEQYEEFEPWEGLGLETMFETLSEHALALSIEQAAFDVFDQDSAFLLWEESQENLEPPYHGSATIPEDNQNFICPRQSPEVEENLESWGF